MARFIYSYKIGKKPRGNFCPRVEMNLEIKKFDNPHRPSLMPIILPSGLQEYKDCDFKNIPYFQQMKQLAESLKIEFCISSKKGKRTSDSEEDTALCNKHYQCKGKCVILWYGNEEYLDVNIIAKKVFYLPWKPGAKPSYEEYVYYFNEFTKVIEKILQDGEDSGESEEYEYYYDSLKQQVKERVKEEVKENKVRKVICQVD